MALVNPPLEPADLAEGSGFRIEAIDVGDDLVDVAVGQLELRHLVMRRRDAARRDAVAEPQEERVVEEELRDGAGGAVLGLVGHEGEIFLDRNRFATRSFDKIVLAAFVIRTNELLSTMS